MQSPHKTAPNLVWRLHSLKLNRCGSKICCIYWIRHIVINFSSIDKVSLMVLGELDHQIPEKSVHVQNKLFNDNFTDYLSYNLHESLNKAQFVKSVILSHILLDVAGNENKNTSKAGHIKHIFYFIGLG